MENNSGEKTINGEEVSKESVPQNVSPEATASTKTEVQDPASSKDVTATEPGTDSAAAEAGPESTSVNPTTESAETDDIGQLSDSINEQELQAAENRIKIVCLEKNNVALKMELKCTELQMEAKEKVDVQKTRLIELLDGKLAAMQKKNTHLMDMLEKILKDKDTHSQRLIEATKHMENLSAKLTESERMRHELRNMNQELKTMLGNIEDKGSQIAKMAKEKLLKYKEENLKIQQQLDDIKGKSRPDGDKSDAGTATPDGAAAAAEGESGDRFQPNWKRIDALQQQLTNAFPAEGLPESVTKINKEIKQELEQLRLETKLFLEASQCETNRFRSALDGVQLLVVEMVRLSQAPPDAAASSGTEDVSAGAAAETRNKEVEDLRERLGQLKATINKLADLNAAALAV